MRPLHTPAPDFRLAATGQTDERSFVSLADLRGRPAIIAFYPADWSPVCGDQMSLYNHVLSEFERHQATLVGISVDSAWCHQAFSDDRRLGFKLLADFEPKGAVARAFGVYRESDGTSERALFVLDADGVIRWSHLSPIDVNPGADGILQALAQITSDRSPAPDRAGDAASPPAPLMDVVSLVEYGDYECPHCRRAHPLVKQLQQHFGDQLRFEYRDFPLAQIHPHAMHAAEAASSVREHAGTAAFWRMHDAIFRHQRDGADALDDAHLAEYAAASGGDPIRVLSDLRAGAFTDRVHASFIEGVKRGVNGTPTFFVNDARFDGDWRDVAQLRRAIERAGSAAESSLSVAVAV